VADKIAKVIFDAARNSQNLRPCQIYREVICPDCPAPKDCNDLDVIMCAVAYLVSKS
jgi:hypothetical protein